MANPCFASLCSLVALATLQPLCAQMPAGFPTPQQMLRGRDQAAVAKFKELSARIKADPRDVNALDTRAVISMGFSANGNYRAYWTYLASKDLERAIQLSPNDFYAWHNYGELNFQSGDLWLVGDHSNARRAVNAYTKAIQINPRSARSYMGRGWAQLVSGERDAAKADFQVALKLDPTLRGTLEREVQNIQHRMAEEAGARSTLDRISRYSVVREARTGEECEQTYHGLWIFSECRVSTGMNPGR